MADTFDVVVIGGGPGGYTAAIRSAQLGFATACIDDWTRAGGKPALGGTCTNVGCIPSKALLQSSENFEHATHGFADHGIVVGNVSLDLAKMIARKDKVVAQNNDGIAYLFKKNRIASYLGRGAFTGRSRPWPWMPTTPFALNSAVMPLVMALTMDPRRFCIAARSSFRSPILMPWRENSSLAR